MRFVTTEQIGVALEALERRVTELERENAELRTGRDQNEKPKVTARSR